MDFKEREIKNHKKSINFKGINLRHKLFKRTLEIILL